MSDTVVIVLIAIGVCALAVVIYFARLFMDGRRLRRERKKAVWRRQVIQHDEVEAQACDNARPYPPGVGPGGMA
ncbi:MAG: hypothetical protein IMZ46_02385 [Acidobacteria bacterium]|nr:hypothetical protein [Acidobacteriota bacterium]